MSLVDSTLTRLTNHWADDGGPSWHPSGHEVYFYSKRDDINYEIYSVNISTKSIQRITNSHNWDLDANFSPDGEKMAWHSSRNGHYGIVITNRDGSQRRRLTNQTQSDFYYMARDVGWKSAINALHEMKLKSPESQFYPDEELVDLMHFLIFAERPDEARQVAQFLKENAFYKGYTYTRVAEILVQLGQEAPPTQSQFFDLLANEQFDQAMISYEESKRFDPNWILFEEWEQFILLQIADNYYFQINQFENAVTLYKIVLEYYPNSYMAYHDMGNCYIELGNIEQGLKFHKKAAELNPNGWYGNDSKQIIEKFKK